MKARPIIFNGEMVRALLNGRKTQTRRVIKPQPKLIMDAEHEGHSMVPSIDGVNELHPKECPFGYKNDLLWVRETHYRFTGCSCNGKPWSGFVESPDRDQYKAIAYDGNDIIGTAYMVAACLKIPAIHMPRWASRITLKITRVRIERLQDISSDDAAAEGDWIINEHPAITFRRTWDSINAKRGYGWDKNPWVWVIEFEVIKKNVDEVLKECSQHA